eukprot:899537-Amphidinium_carterae.1
MAIVTCKSQQQVRNCNGCSHIYDRSRWQCDSCPPTRHMTLHADGSSTSHHCETHSLVKDVSHRLRSRYGPSSKVVCLSAATAGIVEETN